MDTPIDPTKFVQEEVKAVYPRFSILAKLPVEITTPFYPEIKRRWLDRNLRSFGELISFASLDGDLVQQIEHETLTLEQFAEIEAWLKTLSDSFLELVAKRIRDRFSKVQGEPE